MRRALIPGPARCWDAATRGVRPCLVVYLLLRMVMTALQPRMFTRLGRAHWSTTHSVLSSPVASTIEVKLIHSANGLPFVLSFEVTKTSPQVLLSNSVGQ